MSQLVINNFQYGLEYRRSELTAKAGALFDAMNCFVNSGGEIERRRAWFPMCAANSTAGFIKPLDGYPLSPGGNYGEVLGAEFENDGVVFMGAFSLTDTRVPPGVIPANGAAAAADYTYTLLKYSLAGVVGVSYAGGGATDVHITSQFGYAVTVTITENSAAGGVTLTNNGTADVTLSFTGAWLANDHIAVRVQQTNYDNTVGYGVGTMTAYPTFTSYSIFGGGTTVPSSYMRLQDPYEANVTISDIVSCTFAGKVFCLVTWSNGRTYAYYQGTVLQDSKGVGIYASLISGTGSSSTTYNNIAAWIAAVVTKEFQNAGYGGDFTCTSAANVVTFHTSATNITVTGTLNSGSTGTAVIATNGTNNVTMTIGGTWTAGDYFSVLTAAIAAVGTVTASGGVLSGLNPVFCYTFGTKVYLLWNTFEYHSVVNSATDFHTTGSGAGSTDLAKQDTINDTLVTCCAYQGNLAFFFKNSIQIWDMDANDALNQRVQALGNTGAVGRYAVCPIGNLDVIYVDSGGIRSLRPRVASENALPFDVGAPINTQVRAQLRAATCVTSAVILGYEPTNQMLFVSIPYDTSTTNQAYSDCTIQPWLLSYFPDSKVISWSKSDLKYASCVGPVATQQSLWTKKFMTWHGALYSFGRFFHVLPSGANAFDVALSVYDPTNLRRGLYAAGYDNAQAYWVTPFMANNSPGTIKQSAGVDMICSGGWTLYGCLAPSDGTFQTIATVGSAGSSDVTDSSTPEGPGIGFEGNGNHVQFKAVGTVDNVATDLGTLATTPGAQVFSQLIWHYDLGGEKQ